MDIRWVDDEYVWNIPLERAPNAQFLQSWEWGVFQQTFGRKAWRVQVFEGDKVIAAMQCLEHALPLGQRYLYAPRGPIILTDDVELYETIAQVLYRAVKKMAEGRGAVFLRIEPVAADNFDPKLFTPHGFQSAAGLQPQDELAVIVAKEEKDLLAAMHEKTRYNIRVAAKHAVRVRIVEQLDYARRFFPKVWELLQATAARQKIRTHERAYYARMLDLFMPKGYMKLMVAEHENTMVAAHLVTLFGDTVYYLHGGSDYEHRALMAPFALHWEGIRLAKREGKTYYNFGGVAPASQAEQISVPSAGSHKWENLTRFKEGFVRLGDTGKRFHYHDPADLVYRQPLYAAYETGKKLRSTLRFR